MPIMLYPSSCRLVGLPSTSSRFATSSSTMLITAARGDSARARVCVIFNTQVSLPLVRMDIAHNNRGSPQK